MPINNLFNSINTIYIKKRITLTGASLSLRAYATGKKYFFIDLPTTKTPISIGDFTLSNHHLSVHADPIGTLDLKSQYHYTASFIDSEGKELRLHVYFNSEDNFVAEPQLSCATAEGTFEPVDCQEYYQAFRWLARSASDNVVDQIRKRQNQLVTLLQKRYDDQEVIATTLSTDLATNKDLYLTTIGQQLKTLEQIKGYSNNTQRTLGLISYYKKVQIALERLVPTVTKSTAPTVSTDSKREPKPKKESSSSSSSTRLEFFKPPTAPSDTIVLHGISIKKKTGLTKIISGMEEELTQIKLMTGVHLVNSIVDFFNKIVELDIDIEIGIYDASIRDIVAFHKLRDNINKLGKRILEELLANDRFDIATKLAPFHHLIEKTPQFLHDNSPALIDFLLKNKILPVEFKKFTLFGKQYDSVTDYFFKKTKVDAIAINCFDTFVKNGLSLLDIDKNTGLPFAAILLLETEHPLKIILERNAKLTMQNPMFCRQLNQTLKVLIVTIDFPEPKRSQIAELIETIQRHIKVSRVGGTSDTNNLKAFKELSTQVLNEFGEEQITKLKSDSHIVALTRILEERTVELFSKLHRSEKRKFKSDVTSNIESINEYWKKMEFKPSLGFEEIKKATIRHILDQIKTMDLNIELNDINIKLKRYVSYSSKLSATQKQLIKRQQEILTELQNLKNIHDPSKIDKASEVLFTITVKKQLTGMKQLSDKLIELQNQLRFFQELVPDVFKKIDEQYGASIDSSPDAETKDIKP